MSAGTNSVGHCQQIAQILTSLKSELQAVADGQPPHQDPIHPFLVCMELRSLMRNIADELECKSRLVELEKQKIQKRKNYLESLEYYKSMLQNQIEVCAIPVDDVQDVVEQDCRPVDWLEEFPSSVEKLKSWMEDAQNQRAALARKKLHRESVDAEIKKKKKLYNEELPAHLSKIQDGLRTVMTVFDMPPTFLLNPVRNEKLASVYSYLAPLQQCGLVQLVYQEDTLTATITPVSDHGDIRLANSVKLPLEAKQIKLHFSLLGERVVLSVDRSCDFTSEQLFHRLIANEPLLPIYSSPQTEEERNCNTRYQYFNWLQGLGIVTVGNFPLTSEHLLMKLVDRSLCVQIIKQLIDGLRTSKLPWYWKVGSQGTTSTLHIKKLQIVSVTKLISEAARAKLSCPKFLKQLMELRPPTDKQTLSVEHLLHQYFQQRPAPSDNNAQLFSFYEVALNYHNHAIEFIWIVPCSYPERKSRVKMLQYYSTKVKQLPPQLKQKILLRLPPPVGAVLPTASGQCSERRPDDMIRMEQIEQAVNSELAEYGAQQHPNFYALYQLNRLFTILDQMHHQQNAEHSLRRYPDDIV